jgi:DNA polymerase III epsilon subunit-like protein
MSLVERSYFTKYTKKKRLQEWIDFLAYNPRIIVIDTETSGLDPDFNEILSFSWIIVNAPTWTIMEQRDYYFEWSHIVYVDDDAIAINGLNYKELHKHKLSDRDFVLEEFAIAVQNCDLIVGHNVTFDINFLIAAKPKLKKILNSIKWMDTMVECTEFCGIRRGYDYKFPKLSELSQKLKISLNIDNTHHSLYDAQLTLECFKKIAETGCLLLPEKFLVEITAPGYDKNNPILIVRKEKGFVPVYAFRNWKNIKEVIIPEGISEIREHAFEGCCNLEKITFPNSLKIIEKSAFRNCYKLASLDLPINLEAIGTAAFSHCKMLQVLEVPPKVTILGHEIISYCKSLKKIVIPNSVTTAYNLGLDFDNPVFNDKVFYYCPRNSSGKITVPYGITHIADQAFRSCASIEEIELPSSVVSIGALAFEGCSSLQRINVPENAIINTGAFDNCPFSDIYKERIDQELDDELDMFRDLLNSF